MGLVEKIASAVWSGYRMKLGVLAAVCVLGSGYFLYADARHSLSGVDTTATLVDRVEECKAEFQPKGESRRKEVMPCRLAYAFQTAVGTNKVKVEKKTFAFVRFALTDGTEHTAKVSEFTLRSHAVPVGGTVDVVYNPAKPDDTRTQLWFGSIKFHLGLIGLGLAGLLAVFFGPVARFVLGLAAKTGRAPPSDAEESAGTSRADVALDRAIAALKTQAAAAAPVAPTQRTFANDRPRRVAGARTQFGVRS